jgi:hypothetical protein
MMAANFTPASAACPIAATREGVQAPQIVGGEDFAPLLRELEVDRRGGVAAQDEPVDAGELEHRRQVTAAGRLAPDPGEGGACRNQQFGGGGHARADQGPNQEVHVVVRAEGLDGRRVPIAHVHGACEATAAGKATDVALVECDSLDAALPQIDVENYAMYAEH